MEQEPKIKTDEIPTHTARREVDLLAWAADCWKNRRLILAWAAFVMIATALFDYLTPTVYKSTATIGLTKSANDYVSGNRNSLFWLNENPAADIAKEKNIDLKADEVSVKYGYAQNANGFGAVTIDGLAAKPAVARTIAKEVAARFMERANKLDKTTAGIASARRQLLRTLRILKRQKSVLGAQKKDFGVLKKQLTELAPQIKDDPLMALLLKSQLASVTNGITSIENQIFSVEHSYVTAKAQLEQQNIVEGKIEILSISAPRTVGVRRTIDIPLAGLAALIMACLISLVRLTIRTEPR